MADRSLELNQGMSLVVSVNGAGLAVGTKVQIIADSTFVSGATDVIGVRLASGAKRSVAANANMDGRWCTSPDISEWLIDRRKSVARVDDLHRLDASRTVVPVRTVEALVTDTCDVLVAAIANGVVHMVTAWAHLGCNMMGHFGSLDSGGKSVLGVMAVLVLSEAWLAEIEVFADGAMKKLGLRVFLHTAVACPHDAERGPRSSKGLENWLGQLKCLNWRWNLRLDLGLNDSLNFDLRLRLRGDSLGGALD
jgi:hypothetical protein